MEPEIATICYACYTYTRKRVVADVADPSNTPNSSQAVASKDVEAHRSSCSNATALDEYLTVLNR